MERLSPIEFARMQRQCANSYEELMWQLLRNRRRFPLRFRRQQPLGPYTADFFCAEARLVIEIDGEHHFTEEGKVHDAARDRWMSDQGIRVLRFTGKQVDLETEQVLEIIGEFLQASPLTPAPSPARGEGRKEHKNR